MGRIRGCWAELTIIIKSTVTAHDFHSGPSFHPTMTFLHRASRANRIKTSHDITRSTKTMLSNNFLITTIYDIYIYIHPKGFYSWMEFHPSLVFFAWKFFTSFRLVKNTIVWHRISSLANFFFLFLIVEPIKESFCN